jgi:PAS domain S-box-containing protein
MIVSFSKGGEKVLGYTWEEVAGYYIETFSEDPESFEAFMADSQEKGSAVRLEFPFKHKQGHTVYCDVSMINLTKTNSYESTGWLKLDGWPPVSPMRSITPSQ